MILHTKKWTYTDGSWHGSIHGNTLMKSNYFVVCAIFYVFFSSTGLDHLWANEFEEKKPISRYIEENYDILFQSPLLTDLEDADLYLLAEQHDSIGHKHINSMMINHYAEDNDYVFVEGVPSLLEIHSNESLQSMWITAPVKVMGWDAAWMKDITGIDLTEIEKLGIQLLQLQYDIAWNKSYEKKKEYYRLVLKLNPLIKKIQPLFSTDFEKNIKETFPHRVEAMTQSLTTAYNQPYNDKKIFLLAGIYHLWQDKTQDFFDDPKMSLEYLYDHLVKTKSVILVPKQPMTDKWNNFYQIPLN